MTAPLRRTARRIALGVEILRDFVRARWLLRSVDLPTGVARLRGDAQTTSEPMEVAVALRVARAVTRTFDRLPTETPCLVRSLVLVSMLGRRGIRPQLVIGVRPGEEFGAHAWVELDGAPLLPTGAGEYARLTEI